MIYLYQYSTEWFREDIIFTKLRICGFAKIKPSRKFPNLQYFWAITWKVNAIILIIVMIL